MGGQTSRKKEQGIKQGRDKASRGGGARGGGGAGWGGGRRQGAQKHKKTAKSEGGGKSWQVRQNQANPGGGNRKDGQAKKQEEKAGAESCSTQ